jgi:hypothetical protein
VRFLSRLERPFLRCLIRGHWQVFLTALCSTRRRRGRHRWDALRPDKHRAVMARRSGQGMKPLAARACARPLTAPSTMALLEQPNHARCAIQVPDPPFSAERARSRSSAGYRPATLPLDSLVGSLAACPIASLGPTPSLGPADTRLGPNEWRRARYRCGVRFAGDSRSRSHQT